MDPRESSLSVIVKSEGEIMPPQVAKDVVSYCSSCKRDVLHTIVAMKEDRIVRVLCLSCKKQHAFRHSPDSRILTPARTPSAGRTPQKRIQAAIEDWRSEMYKVKDAPGKKYSLDGLFEEGEKVIHSTFGPGIVKELVSSDKMQVLFEGGMKLLVRGNSRLK
jgi:hypothetical protein